MTEGEKPASSATKAETLETWIVRAHCDRGSLQVCCAALCHAVLCQAVLCQAVLCCAVLCFIAMIDNTTTVTIDRAGYSKVHTSQLQFELSHFHCYRGSWDFCMPHAVLCCAVLSSAAAVAI